MNPGVLWPSLPVLKKVCDHWFLNQTGSIPFIPILSPEYSSDSEIIDLILLGRLHDEILSCETWPDQKIRLWSLGRASRLSRCDVAKIPFAKMGLLPRYELFPQLNAPVPFPQKGEPWTLIYSGRMTADKSFGLFLKVASCLQNKCKEKVKPIIYGITEINKNEKALNEARELQKLLATLPWTERPEINFGMTSDQWIEQEHTRPVLFNFSVFENDEFGVSVAQAQSKGWPLLLSAWGGHLDVHGPNVRTFSVTESKVKDLSPSSVDSLCEKILIEMGSDNSPQMINARAIFPEAISKEDLVVFKNNLVQRCVVPKEPWPSEVLNLTLRRFSGEKLDD